MPCCARVDLCGQMYVVRESDVDLCTMRTKLLVPSSLWLGACAIKSTSVQLCTGKSERNLVKSLGC